MNRLLRVLALALALVLLVPTVALAEGEREALQQHLDAGRWERAVEVAEALLVQDPGDGFPWYGLGYAHHARGEYRRAAECGERAAELSAEVRATALYNVACARALLGELGVAAARLDDAVAAGFLDFGLMATDPDLDPLRAEGRLAQLPPEARYETHGRGDSRRIRYRVLLPEGHDPEREYPALLVFPPGPARPDADWVLAELLRGGVGEEAIVVVVVAPPTQRGWFTHPAHHALEALLKDVRREHRVVGDRFVMAGFGAGARAANTYSRMSRKFADGLVLVAGQALGGLDADDARDSKRTWRDLPVGVLVGSEDEASRISLDAGVGALRDAGVDVRVERVEGDGPLLASLRGPALVRRVFDLVAR